MATLPASLSKTYCTRANIPFPSVTSMAEVSKSMYWLLKAALRNEIATGTLTGTRHANSIWTCIGSSDGVTAAMDGTDRWLSSYDSSKIVQAANASPHSWIVLYNATLAMYLLIDCNTATASTVRIAASSLPYTINLTDARRSPLVPSPTNTSFVLGSASADSVSAGSQFNYWASEAAAAYYKHYAFFTFTDDGQFYYLTSRAGGGSFAGAMWFIRATDAHNSDPNQYYLVGGINNGAPPWPGNPAVGQFCVGLTPTGGTSSGGLSVWYFGTTGSTTITTFADQISGEVWFYDATIWATSPLAYRGKIADTFLSVGGRSGVLLPDAAAPRWVMLSNLAVPYVGVPPII